MNDLQGYYKPLFDTLYGRYAAHVGLSRRALREALGAAAFPSALHRWDPGARAIAQEVLSLCLPVMEALSPAPDSGWLPYIYAYLADRMFPDARFAPPAQPETQALEFFLTVFTWLLARRAGALPVRSLDRPLHAHPGGRGRKPYPGGICRIPRRRPRCPLRRAPAHRPGDHAVRPGLPHHRRAQRRRAHGAPWLQRPGSQWTLRS